MLKKSVGLVSSISQSIEPSDLGSAAYKDTGTSSGQIPVLDSNGKLNTSTIPAVAITDVFTASSQQDMLALSAEKGDICIRSDENKTYLLMDSPASTLSNWVQISNTTSVISVNTKTGTVTLNADDVGAVSKNNAITGDTKCKITYDSKGLVTSGANLQASDIPDLSATYMTKNAAITGNTKCKITYDSNGLVTAGSDLQASDIPDLSTSYVSKNNAITSATKCKITYDTKGLVTAGADLQASDIPDISATYLTKNASITGDTKCKITYDSNGLVTAGADLQSSDIPDLSSSYVAKNAAITGDTKCKITYDNKGLVTAGTDLQASDIPDLSSNYVTNNTAITGATKCKITYDSKGLVTAGDNLAASDLPSHTHSFSDLSSGTVPLANGGTGATTSADAMVNLGFINNQEVTFNSANEATYISDVQNYFETNNTKYVPYVFNAEWTNNGYGVAAGVRSKDNFSETLLLFNQRTGLKLYQKNTSTWNDYSPGGIPIYVNTSGIQGTVNFVTGYTAEQFKFLKVIYFADLDNGIWLRNAATSPATIGTNINMTAMQYNGSNFSCYTRTVTINSTSLTLASNLRGHLVYTSPSSGGNTTNDKIYISHVIGYKYY